MKNTSRSPEELVNVHLGRSTVLPNKLVNKLVQNCIAMDQRYYGLTDTSGYMAFWFETSI